MNLEKSKVRVIRVLGNINYLPGAEQSEDIVALFACVPEEFHLELIEHILFWMSCSVPENRNRVGSAYQVEIEEVRLALTTEWGNEFRASILSARKERVSLKEMADVVHSFMDGDLVHNVAIFAFILFHSRITERFKDEAIDTGVG